MIRPNNPSSSVIGPSPQADSSYPSHRYPSPSMPGRENMPPQQMGSYQGRPMGPSQYPGPNSQTSGQSPYPPSQPDSYRNTEFQVNIKFNHHHLFFFVSSFFPVNFVAFVRS